MKTNHIDRLDPALLRAGRIDKKISYKLATKHQAWALYKRFFPESSFADEVAGAPCVHKSETKERNGHSVASSGYTKSCLSELAHQFSDAIPEEEFSTAELQGYLLTYKMKPFEATRGVAEWVAFERKEKRDREEREEMRKEKLRSSRTKTKTAMVAEFAGPSQQPKVNSDGHLPTSISPTTPSSPVTDTKPPVKINGVKASSSSF